MVKELLCPNILGGVCHSLEFSSFGCLETAALCRVRDKLGFCRLSCFFSLLGSEQHSPGALHNIDKERTPRLISFCLLLFASLCLFSSKPYTSTTLCAADTMPRHFLCQGYLVLSLPFAFIIYLLLFDSIFKWKTNILKGLLLKADTPCSFSLLWAPFLRKKHFKRHCWMVISGFV